MSVPGSPNVPSRRAAEMGAAALRVGGVTAFTATDFPGKLAAAVFIQGCPWRCGYCHNPHLQPRQGAPLTWADVMALLVRRAGLLDGVVFSGGEPTMDPALPFAMAAVRQMGLAVGLHTACIYPRQLKEVLPLVDWVGFDIKAPFEQYPRVTGVFDSGAPARACLEMIIDSGVAHECRTTLHPAFLSEADVVGLAGTLADAGVRNYAIQTFRAQGCADAGLNATAGTVMGEAALQRIAARFEQFIFRPA